MEVQETKSTLLNLLTKALIVLKKDVSPSFNFMDCLHLSYLLLNARE